MRTGCRSLRRSLQHFGVRHGGSTRNGSSAPDDGDDGRRLHPPHRPDCSHGHSRSIWHNLSTSRSHKCSRGARQLVVQWRWKRQWRRNRWTVRCQRLRGRCGAGFQSTRRLVQAEVRQTHRPIPASRSHALPAPSQRVSDSGSPCRSPHSSQGEWLYASRHPLRSHSGARRSLESQCHGRLYHHHDHGPLNCRLRPRPRCGSHC